MKQVSWVEAVGGKVCLIDRNGNVLLEPQIEVDALSYPSNGISVVKKDGKYGYINARGELVIPFQYKKAYPFSENGLAFVIGDDGLGGYIDKTGEFIIDPIYETGTMFNFGFAAVSKNGEYKYIYNNGSKAINNTFKYAGGFSDCGLAKVVTFDGAHSLMDTMSRVVLQLKVGAELEEFKEGTRITKFCIDGKGEALINAAGQIITGFFEKVDISPYSNLHAFLRRGLWGYVNNEGEEIIPNIYKDVSPCYDNKVVKVKVLHPLSENEEVEIYINKKDEIVDYEKNDKMEENFSYIDRFRKAVALAIKKETRENKQKDVDHSIDEESLKRFDQMIAGMLEEYKDELDEGDDYTENREIGLYEIEIRFHDMVRSAIIPFIQEEIIWDYKIIKLKDNYVKFLFLSEAADYPGFIEQVMHDVVHENNLGKYRCSRVY